MKVMILFMSKKASIIVATRAAAEGAAAAVAAAGQPVEASLRIELWTALVYTPTCPAVSGRDGRLYK